MTIASPALVVHSVAVEMDQRPRMPGWLAGTPAPGHFPRLADYVLVPVLEQRLSTGAATRSPPRPPPPRVWVFPTKPSSS